MKIPQNILDEYTTFDPESSFFYQVFDEPEGVKILEVGSHDAPTASMLAKSGFNVTGIDLRDCDQAKNYKHIVGDFCTMPEFFVRESVNSYDCIISISSIEHFGLGTYKEGNYRSHLDFVAMRKIYDYLKVGGTCYISVPFGGKFIEFAPHWRVYNWEKLNERLIQDFKLEFLGFKVCEDIFLMNRIFKSGEIIDFTLASFNLSASPAISCCFKMRKM